MRVAKNVCDICGEEYMEDMTNSFVLKSQLLLFSLKLSTRELKKLDICSPCWGDFKEWVKTKRKRGTMEAFLQDQFEHPPEDAMVEELPALQPTGPAQSIIPSAIASVTGVEIGHTPTEAKKKFTKDCESPPPGWADAHGNPPAHWVTGDEPTQDRSR